ncbi:uncharacterized protein LOC113236020 isoform X2 [Hyposmocoma kahamanoa]|uniref:uncharacterized protein LOC113236020 isoform X2 n=1 Tax=Hyposmocoma kahamanoa TaxID=1477025 RepID=UPI000E6D947B|nr:uncharacterized protein LOC113236020 isoform X2 [Hyposmocoma kahamanoa]
MSFELGEPKQNEDMFFDRKSHVQVDRTDENGFQSDMTHKDLFETISEAHYLPELGGPHDEALLESLVEKGCEDNQILGQALDKLAHLVHGSGDYAEEEDDMLLGNAPVSDIIDRLEQSLESPGRSSITAAQSLLHLHNITDHFQPPDSQQNVDHTYMSDEVFESQASTERTMTTLSTHTEATENSHIKYEESVEKTLEDNTEDADARKYLYTKQIPDPHETYDKSMDDQHLQTLPDQSEMTALSDAPNYGDSAMCIKSENISDDDTQAKNIEETVPIATLDFKELEDNSSNGAELVATDLSIKHVEKNTTPMVVASVAETTNTIEDNISDKSDEQPKDLTVHRRMLTPHASPRRIDIPRAPSRESDAMQSPQPSGIPAVPSSPEIFTMPPTKIKNTLFLETLLSSSSPKMYTSEVTITKQQCEPLNLGKHRKSASPTVSSCSDEMKKINKEFGEPPEKKTKSVESTTEEEDTVKIAVSENKDNRSERQRGDDASPLKQFQVLKMCPNFNIPDPLLVPKDKLDMIIDAPAREIPALLIQRPELRLPQAFSFPALLQDPSIRVVSLSQLENMIANKTHEHSTSQHPKEVLEKEPKETNKSVSTTTKTPTSTTNTSSTENAKGRETPTSANKYKNQPKPIPSMDALAGDIDAATSAALNQMLWLPYLSQLEAMAACSQNMDFLKALSSSGYSGPNYPELSQMFNHPGRFMSPAGFPMMPPMDYDNRMQFAMWQEAMKHANASGSHKPNASNTLEAPMKEVSSKSSDVQNPFVHSTKNTQNKQHSAARTSPIAHNYNSSQRSMSHNPFLQGMYPGMNSNIRPNMPLPGLQIPYFNPNMMGSQRSPRTGQQKSPTSPYYPNNNYLQSVKHSEGHHQRSSSTGSVESPRPRIAVRSMSSLQNMMEPPSSGRPARGSSGSSSSSGTPSSRRRDEPEVGSTTPLGEPPPPHLPHNPHDPSSFPLWHPLFGNQKGYPAPWPWASVTATGD